MKQLLPVQKVFFLFSLLVFSTVKAQHNPAIDSLLHISLTTTDTVAKVDALCALSGEYKYFNSKKSSAYAEQALSLSQQINYRHGEVMAMNLLAVLHQNNGNYSEALTRLKDALQIAEAEKDLKAISQCFLNIGDVYSTLKSYDKAISNYEKSAALAEQTNNDQDLIIALSRIGNRNMDKGNDGNDTTYIVKAIAIYNKTKTIAEQTKNNPRLINAYINLADAYIIFGRKTKNRN